VELTVIVPISLRLVNGRLAGKVAVVTGASSGIGEASAVAMCREGANVAIVARRMAEGENVASRARAAGAECGGEAVFIPADVTDEAAVEALAAAVVERFGPAVHVLFNNVGGVVGAGRFPRERLVNFEATIRLTLTSAWIVTRSFWPALEAAHGASVINNSTAQPRVPSRRDYAICFRTTRRPATQRPRPLLKLSRGISPRKAVRSAFGRTTSARDKLRRRRT
jgi:NAD(P)-dependent dehydrogenase (short-subunit alcohol dehydrogenase family)